MGRSIEARAGKPGASVRSPLLQAGEAAGLPAGVRRLPEVTSGSKTLRCHIADTADLAAKGKVALLVTEVQRLATEGMLIELTSGTKQWKIDASWLPRDFGKLEGELESFVKRSIAAKRDLQNRVEKGNIGNANRPRWLLNGPYVAGKVFEQRRTLEVWSIYRDYLDGCSFEDIAENLATRGRGHKEPASIAQALFSPSAIGLWGSTPESAIPATENDYRPDRPALLKLSTFRHVLDLRKARGSVPKRESERVLLSGLLWCGDCGSKVSLKVDSRRNSITRRCATRCAQHGKPFASEPFESTLLEWLLTKDDFLHELSNPLQIDEEDLVEAMRKFAWSPASRGSLEAAVRAQEQRLEQSPQHALRHYIERMRQEPHSGRKTEMRRRLRQVLLKRVDRIVLGADLAARPQQRDYEPYMGFEHGIDLQSDHVTRATRTHAQVSAQVQLRGQPGTERAFTLHMEHGDLGLDDRVPQRPRRRSTNRATRALSATPGTVGARPKDRDEGGPPMQSATVDTRIAIPLAPGFVIQHDAGPEYEHFISIVADELFQIRLHPEGLGNGLPSWRTTSRPSDSEVAFWLQRVRDSLNRKNRSILAKLVLTKSPATCDEKEIDAGWLGSYCVSNGSAEVRLYVDSIESTAKDLGCSSRDLARIVLKHEIGHHVAPATTEEMAEYNSRSTNAQTSRVETAAQLFAWFTSDAADRDLMRKWLDRYPSDAYRIYQELLGFAAGKHRSHPCKFRPGWITAWELSLEADHIETPLPTARIEDSLKELHQALDALLDSSRYNYPHLRFWVVPTEMAKGLPIGPDRPYRQRSTAIWRDKSKIGKVYCRLNLEYEFEDSDRSPVFQDYDHEATTNVSEKVLILIESEGQEERSRLRMLVVDEALSIEAAIENVARILKLTRQTARTDPRQAIP